MYFDLYFKEIEGYREERAHRPSEVLDICSKEMPDFISFYGRTHLIYYTKNATLDDIENFIDTILVAVNG